jgi:cephalosporin-C deacetylase
MVAATAPYFDVINFAPRIKAPVVAAMGFIDTTSPPVGIWAALNQIPVPHEAIPMIDSDHDHITPEKQGAWAARSKEVRDLILKGGKFVPDEKFTKP